MAEKRTRRVVVFLTPSEYIEIKRRADLLGLGVGPYLKLAERLARVEDIKNALLG